MTGRTQFLPINQELTEPIPPIMRKHVLFTATATLLMCTVLNAQNPTPNAGFENWTQVGNHFDPNNWNTLNPSTAIIGVFTCTRATGADVHSGTYAIKLTTKSVFGVNANGIASTATLITTPPYGITGGIPYTQRPDSIVGWYKCAPASAADSGFVQFVLQGSANDTIGIARFGMPNSAVTTYTRFSKALTYFSPATPVNSYWILSSSDGVNPIVNSTLIIDDLALVFNSVGMEEHDNGVPVELLNSLVSDIAYVSNHTSEMATVRIYNASGALMLSSDIGPGQTELNISKFSNGIYFYQIAGVASSLQLTGKLLKY
jgi:hypothetical protein